MVLAIVSALILNWLVSPAAAAGIVLGAVFSALNFILIPLGWRFCLAADRKRASALSLASIVGRYLILSLPLVFSANSSRVSFLTTAVGIMAVQIYLIASHAAGKLKLALFGETRKGESIK